MDTTNTVSAEMKLNELKEIAKEYDVVYRVGMTKVELAGLINEAMQTDHTEVEVGVEEVDAVETPAEVDLSEFPVAQAIVEMAPETEERIKEIVADALPVEEKPSMSKREEEEVQVYILRNTVTFQTAMEAETKAEAIRILLTAGYERKHIAKAMEVRYQMVYQVEQRMKEAAAKTEEEAE